MAKVLGIAYDDEAASQIEMLTDGGHDVSVVRTAAEALTALESGAYEVLLLDWWMADMSAIHLMDELRGRPEAVSLRTLLVTANTDEGDIRRAFARGVDGYVGRPFEDRELSGAVNRVLVSSDEELEDRREEELSKARMLQALADLDDGTA